MKKLISMLVCVVICSSCASQPASTKSIINSLHKKDSKRLESFFSKELRSSLRGDVVTSAILDKEKIFGPLRDINFFSKESNTQYFVMNFETAKSPLKLILNEKDKVSGIWMGNHIASESDIIKIKSFDGLELTTKVSKPTGSVNGVVIMIHGSGPNDYNENGAGEDRAPSDGFFHRISNVFTNHGFATVRFNKRSTELKFLREMGSDISKFKNNQKYYNAFLKDINVIVDEAKDLFPGHKVYLFGHSQGTGLSLQVANKREDVEGIILTGFSTVPIMFSSFSQYIYRPHEYFKKLDDNSDNNISKHEADKNLAGQFSIIDIDKNNLLSLDEFNAANMINFNRSGMGKTMRALTIEELKLPSVVKILEDSKFKIIFAQGEWDHQTPASFSKSILHMNNLFWKKKNMEFMFFPKLGHELNLQSTPIEYEYRPVDFKIIEKIVKKLKSL